MQYIISLTTLSLIEFLNNNCERKYVNDLEMTREEIIEIYRNTNFHRIMLNAEELTELYKIFVKEYIDSNQQKRIYILLPRLTLTINTINNYFYCLFELISKEDDFNKLIGVKKFIPNNTIMNIIKPVVLVKDKK